MRGARLTVMAVLMCTAVLADAGDREIMVVGEPSDMRRACDDLRLPVRTVRQITDVPDGAQSALVLAESYPQPRGVTAAEQAHLERLCRAGMRLFVEYARPQSGSWFGVTSAPEPQRPLYERLVVLKQLGTLQPEDLLEEHDSACLPFARLPDGAETLLEYDLALGTYDRVPWPERGVFTVTVDLGQVRELASVSQRYGAGEPNYRPESVELWLSADGQTYERVGADAPDAQGGAVTFGLAGRRARFLRFVARKLKRSPVTDFLFMGEVEARDAAGANVALRAPYTITPADAQSGPYRDDGWRLTDGLIEGHWSDHKSVGFDTPPPREGRRFPALVRVPYGRGEVLLCAPKISDYARRHFRLTRRWEELTRQIVLELLPPERRAAAAARYVPLEAHTEPRVWVEPGAEVRLVVTTATAAEVSVRGDRDVTLTRAGEGKWEGRFVARAGQHNWAVTARTPTGSAKTTVALDVRPRREKYREALDRNMRWFTGSGVLASPDGRGGIYSQVCVAWLDSKPRDYDFLASPFRVDCNAMTAEALYLYGLLSGQDAYQRIACHVADSVVAHQYTDPGKASLGAFPWLYDNCDTIFFWDDNSRIGVALLWMYHWTGREEYLRVALLNGELFRQVARDDGCVHRHAIGRNDLDRLGRDGYRQFSQGADPDFRLTHWFDLAAVTGDELYGGLGRQVADTYGGGLEGLAHAQHYAPDPTRMQTLHDMAEGFLNNEMVRRYGMTLAGGGDYALAFEGDCGIATRTNPAEPLTDQIYGTPWAFRAALRAWKASGDDSCRRMCELVGDYLARLQFRDDDPRLDGCWMRGFDLENWEYYGAPYDPAYGPYSAYTGWMNAIAAQAFAWYLLDEAPFIPDRPDGRAAAMLAEVRTLNPKLISDGPNLALGRTYVLDDPSSGPYADEGKKLTDGIIDGPYSDHRSVGWHLDEGQSLRRTMTLDLGAVRRVKLITQQYGAGRGTYNPDLVRVMVSEDGNEFRPVLDRRFGTEGPGLLWGVLEQPMPGRYIRIELAKQRRDAVTDFMFVGETKVFGE